ncbi:MULTISPECIES: hypothetical protein [Terribacillus]|jgi:hypothetical protein|nr:MULTISPECIES: hypothetical protein [Terribacillus]QXE02706.1 hypothetical protein KS242_05850 [Terribacillus sp. DMT04]
MSKRSKSKRITSQGAQSVRQHDEIFVYRERFSDTVKKQKSESHNGGF